MTYECDKLGYIESNRIWFERRKGATGHWRRIEPVNVSYRLVSFDVPNTRQSTWRATVRAPVSSLMPYARNGYDLRVRSHMMFFCGGGPEHDRQQLVDLSSLLNASG